MADENYRELKFRSVVARCGEEDEDVETKKFLLPQMVLLGLLEDPVGVMY